MNIPESQSIIDRMKSYAKECSSSSFAKKTNDSDSPFLKLTKEERIKLRLQIVPLIINNEQYYEASLGSRGIDYKKLTHSELSLFKATMSIVEADIIIDSCFIVEQTDFYDACQSLANLMATPKQQ